MARVTVEDCITIIPNRFELVIAAAQRAKQISAGAPLTVDRDNDKDSVVSLREIAEKTVHKDELIEEVINASCKKQAPENFEAAPFGEEMNDEMRRLAEVKEVMDDAGKFIPQKDAGEGMSFESENVQIDD